MCNTSVELNETDLRYYVSMIGTLRCIIEIGRVDITCAVSIISIGVEIPR